MIAEIAEAGEAREVGFEAGAETGATPHIRRGVQEADRLLTHHLELATKRLLDVARGPPLERHLHTSHRCLRAPSPRRSPPGEARDTVHWAVSRHPDQRRHAAGSEHGRQRTRERRQRREAVEYAEVRDDGVEASPEPRACRVQGQHLSGDAAGPGTFNHRWRRVDRGHAVPGRGERHGIAADAAAKVENVSRYGECTQQGREHPTSPDLHDRTPIPTLDVAL